MASSFLDLAAFKARFGEFKDLPDATIQARLDEAEEEIDATVWDDQTSQGHGFLTADLLYSSGPGRETGKGTSVSTYRRRYDELVVRVGGSYRLILD